ncbi:uncharacterized protein LOC117639498 isoform X2 [Thrips palmi]|nr:uncharacterized protein LOC117639498 isoform X2 [Thrips palmi]
MMGIDSIDKATGALCDLFVIYLSIYKIFVLLKNKQLIRSLVEALKFDMDVQYAPLRRACREHEEQTHKQATKLTFMYYMVLLSVDATYIFMFLRAEWNDVVGIPQWDPLSLRRTNNLTFFFYACVPISAALMSGIHTTVFDTMILSFSMGLGAKIDNLARLLRTLEEEPKHAAHGVHGDGLVEVHRERLQRLHDAVRLHQRIIRFVDELESALSSMSLAQLLESLAAVCLQAYRLTAAPPSPAEAVPLINFCSGFFSSCGSCAGVEKILRQGARTWPQ